MSVAIYYSNGGFTAPEVGLPKMPPALGGNNRWTYQSKVIGKVGVLPRAQATYNEVTALQLPRKARQNGYTLMILLQRNLKRAFPTNGPAGFRS